MACMVFSSYFRNEDKPTRCSGKVIVMPNFWLSASDNKLDAVICEGHADLYMKKYSQEYRKGYLTNRIIEARAQL